MGHATSPLAALVRLPFEHWEERRLAAQASHWSLPHHVGLILDGNRRFARETGLGSVVEGHARGADKLHEVLRWFYDVGVKVVTVWIFSLENFQRQPEEVQGLLGLIEKRTRELKSHPDVHHYGIKVRYLGRLELLPEGLRQAIREAEEATAHYTGHQLNVAIAYGGRQEIADAVCAYLREHGRNGHTPADLAAEFTAETLDRYLYTAGVPDPDLIIRTSGEVRLSGFLLWQSAYAEYYFCDNYWPAFRQIDLLRALRAYHRRQRRFGR